MSLLKKGYIVTWYIRTHIHLGMIDCMQILLFQWQDKYHYTSKLSGTKYALLKRVREESQGRE